MTINPVKSHALVVGRVNQTRKPYVVITSVCSRYKSFTLNVILLVFGIKTPISIKV